MKNEMPRLINAPKKPEKRETRKGYAVPLSLEKKVQAKLREEEERLTDEEGQSVKLSLNEVINQLLNAWVENRLIFEVKKKNTKES